MVIIRDNREQMPFDFGSYSDVSIRPGTLQTGDYSLEGFEGACVIERKSVPDLVGCLGNGRDRFIREIERARGIHSFMVLVEGSYGTLANGNYRGKLNPASAIATVAALLSRWRIPFFFADSRPLAEGFAYQFFRQFIQGKRKELRAMEKNLSV